MSRFFAHQGLRLTLAAALVILGAAFLYEQVTGLAPCPLCWLQRWVFVGFAAVSLLALVVQRQVIGAWLCVFLYAALTLLGSGLALRHLYIKQNPQAVSCGLDVEALLSFFPWQEALKQMLLGSADCVQQANFLGLPLPTWSLTAYLLLGALGIWTLRVRHRSAQA